MSDVVTLGRESYWNHGLVEEELLQPLPPPPSFPEELSAVGERVRQMIGKIRVPHALDQAHKLIARLLEEDERRREKQRNASYPSSWDNPIFDSVIERRRLRILNTLFIAVERAACKPSIRGHEGRELNVQVGQQYVRFILDRVQGYGRALRKKRQESNRLRLELQPLTDTQKTRILWEDNDTTTLEKQIEDIALGIILAGERQYRETAQRLYEWRVQRKAELEKEIHQRKAEEERRERERQIALERGRIERLLSEATALRQANEIRAYVEAARSAILSQESIPREEFDAWASWALSQADRIDPLKSETLSRLIRMKHT